MNHPLSLSIVTPSLNQAAYIGEALVSVRDQRYPNLEHIVVDGGSSDETINILRQCSEMEDWGHLHWVSEPDQGQSSALNKGFKRATGDIVGWLNSDDRYRPRCCESVVRIFQQRQDVDIVYGDYTWIDRSGKVLRIRREIEFSRFILLYHRVLYIPTTATFIRRRVFEQGNWLDEDLHYAMDFEFFVRLAAKEYRFVHVPEVLADFRFQPASKTCSTPHKQLEEIERVLQLHSPVLKRVQTPMARRAALLLLRSCAGALRYSEKLRRGHYFNQFRFAPLNSCKL